jgi:hypothetical protein
MSKVSLSGRRLVHRKVAQECGGIGETIDGQTGLDMP